MNGKTTFHKVVGMIKCPMSIPEKDHCGISEICYELGQGEQFSKEQA